MATALKVLGQSKPSAATLTNLYTVPALTNTTVSTIMVSNQSATTTSFRISVAQAGAIDTASQYLYYNISIPGNDTFAATLGITLATTDEIRVYATLATLSFSAFGAETT